MDDCRAVEVLRAVGGLEAHKLLWESVWDKLRRRIMPRRVGDGDWGGGVGVPDEKDADFFSPRACRACQRLAAAHLTYITPINQVWFKYKSRNGDDSDSWYARCSEKAIKVLAQSNFYAEVHEAWIDRCLLGTGCLYFGGDDSRDIIFKFIPCGSYGIAENASGQVDTLCRRFKYSAKQAADEFKECCLGEKVREALADPARMYEVRWEFVHLVRPRKVWMPGSDNKMEWEFESVYVSVDDGCVVEEGGYHEFPYLVCRFLKWGNSPFGLPPGIFAEPNIYRESFLKESLDLLCEIAVNPRVLLAADQVGEVNFRAGGQTIITSRAVSEGLPREWLTAGEYKVGRDRVEDEGQEIDSAFFVDMLTNISSVDREMTATEVMAREGEKVLPFSPSFTYVVSDLFPFHKRLFNILARSGDFGSCGVAPKGAVKVSRVGGVVSYVDPSVSYCGKIALALDGLQSDAIPTCLNILSMVAQFDQSVVDLLNLPEAMRVFLRAKGFPEVGINSEERVAEVAKQREDVQAMAQEVEMMKAGAGVAKDGAQAVAIAQGAGVSL